MKCVFLSYRGKATVGKLAVA